MNTIAINGHLAADAQIKYIGSKNTACVNFSIGKNKSFRNERGNLEKKAMFFDVVMFGNYANELHQKLLKGCPVFVQGELNAEYWTSKEDGSKHSRVNIIAQKVYVYPKNNTQSAPQPNTQTNTQQHTQGQCHEQQAPQNQAYAQAPQNTSVINGQEFMQQVHTMPQS